MNITPKLFKPNPALLFIYSFLSLIALGTLLLLLPCSTHQSISFIDAVFTSTSASCITGLIVVDTSSVFTLFGKTVIMVLIQLGGVGVLTFASYFSYFFKRGASYENQLFLSSISSINKLGEVFTVLKRILLITLSIEAVGAISIYLSISKSLIPSLFDRIYFSVFHSVSAFCNAGFSTLPQGIMEEGYVHNYPFQLSLIFLLVLGGLGFPVVINILSYVKYFFKSILEKIFSHKKYYRPRILTLGSRISLITTAILIIVGTVVLFFSEYDGVLASHSELGKYVTALFTATTPRTAGFNSINFSELQLSSILLIIILMWIGGSPASTAGGIKTSTFAISILNFIHLVQGKKTIEIGRREIADISIQRAFATMTLSLLVIGCGVISISYFEHDLTLIDIIFECFSAYSTVGLSLGITAGLGWASKLTLIALMFIGRVTMLTILIALLKKVKTTNYSYPTEEILIN